MPVPLSVMQAAAQGDKKAMRLVEQEYGVGDGRRYAENWLSEEEPPPIVPGKIKGIEHPTRRHGQWDQYEYRKAGREQVEQHEAKMLAEKIARMQSKADMQDVLLKIAGEDRELAQTVGEILQIGGITTTAAAGMAALPISVGGGPFLAEQAAYFGGLGGATGTLPAAIISGGLDPTRMKQQRQAGKMAELELSPEAQKVYDEWRGTNNPPKKREYSTDYRYR